MVQSFEDFELDEAQFELRCVGQRVPMEPQVFQVLAFLVQNHERVVTKDELIGHVWPERFISDAALNSRVMAARKAVGDNGRDQRLIRTIHGRGYRFVGQVRDADAPAPAPGAATDPVYGSEPALVLAPALPAPLLESVGTSFVGRAEELGRLVELLGRPSCRLLTIVGPGGVGKTRLAAEAVQRVRDAGVDVVAVAAQPLATAPELPIAIAGALGMALSSDDTAFEIATRLGTRELLLFLDNVEHLVAESGEMLSGLLARASGLRIVVTSREVLGLREEWLFPVGGLSLAPTSDAPSDAVRLFLEREAQAGALDPASSGPADERALAEICGLVDGMPLALELAASLRRYLPRSAVAEQIAADLAVLRVDLRNVPERHRSIPGLLEQSFRRLTVEQARCLLSLSVFEDTFSASAAEAVAGASLQTLGELVNRSLLQPRVGRFALHPLLRQFCRDRAGPAYGELQTAHAEYYARFVADRAGAMEGAGQVSASGEIAVEFANAGAAWRWMAAEKRLDLLAMAAYPAYMFAQLRSRFVEAREGIEQAISAAEDAGDEGWALLAELLIFKAWLFVRTTHSVETLDVVARAETLLTDHAASPRHGFGMDPLALLSMIQWETGRPARGEQTARASLERCLASGDEFGAVYARWLMAATKFRLARLEWHPVAGRVGAYRAADAAADRHLAEVGELLDLAAAPLVAKGERWFYASVQMERAFVAEARGDRASRIRLYEEALALRSQFEDWNGIADILVRLADAHHANSDHDSATRLLREAEPIVFRVGDLGVISEFERSSGFSAWVRGDLAEATERFIRCVELSLRIGFATNILGSLRGLADVLLERGETETAAEVLALVTGHPASMPFARARAEWSLLQLVPALGDEAIETARQRARGYDLGTFTRALVDQVR